MSISHSSADIVIPLYNNWQALHVLSADIQVWLQFHPSLTVIVVDDGSAPDPFDLPVSLADHRRFKLIRHSENRGRASACNSGFWYGRSEFVGFLDVDCSPQEGWIDAFLGAISTDSNCVFGNLKAYGDSYWSRYLNDLYKKKSKKILNGARNFNTPFCMFRREVLVEVGGFNEEYAQYGFEDQDLIQSIRKISHLFPVFLPNVYATHQPPKSLNDVLDKAIESGRSSSKIFSRRFPHFYKKTSYWYFDAEEHSLLYRVLLSAMWWFLDNNVLGLKVAMNREKLPFSIWKYLVKLSTGLAYFNGTSQRELKG